MNEDGTRYVTSQVSAAGLVVSPRLCCVWPLRHGRPKIQNPTPFCHSQKERAP